MNDYIEIQDTTIVAHLMPRLGPSWAQEYSLVS